MILAWASPFKQSFCSFRIFNKTTLFDKIRRHGKNAAIYILLSVPEWKFTLLFFNIDI